MAVPPPPRVTPSTRPGVLPRRSVIKDAAYYQGHPYEASTHPYAAGQAGYKPRAPRAASAPAAGAPPAGGTDPATHLPWDTIYQQSLGLIDRNVGNAEANYTQGASALGQSYGFSFDPVSGAVADDPSNPFARAALLKRSYENNVRGTGNRMAAQGQLYAGSLQNAQNENRHQYDTGYDTLKRSFQSQAQNLLARRRQAELNADQQRLDSLTAAYGRAAGSTPADPGVDQGQPSGGASVASGRPSVVPRPVTRRKPPPAPRPTPSTRPSGRLPRRR